MKIIIDTERQTLTCEQARGTDELQLYSTEAFNVISQQWLQVGWNQKYTYGFTWLGRPVIQLPEDLIRIQEVIYSIKPDVILETGIAHGGSLIFYASLCKVLGKGRVIGIDKEIRPHNRTALETHPLFRWLTLVEGSSVDPNVVARVRALIAPSETVLVLLDSCHTKEHVLAELEAYSPLITAGSYIVATDGIMAELGRVPRGKADWESNNPIAAVRDFLQTHPEFKVEDPPFLFNEGAIRDRITHWPSAFLLRAA